MSLESAFAELATAFERIRNTLGTLHLTVIEDQPPNGSVALVDWFEDLVQDLLGEIELGVDAVGRGHLASGIPRDLDDALQSLVESQHVRDRLTRRLSTDRAVRSRLEELRRFGMERGGEWRSWCEEALASFDRCRDTVGSLVDPLFATWQLLATELASPVVSVQTTSIGQQFGAHPTRQSAHAND